MTREEKKLAVQMVNRLKRKYDWNIVVDSTERSDDNFDIQLFEIRPDKEEIADELFHTEYYHTIANVLQLSDYVSINVYGEGRFLHKPYFKMY